jgi:hypothetical protein
MAGQQLRSLRQVGEAVRRIHEGVIGEVIMVKAQREASADLPHVLIPNSYKARGRPDGGHTP